LAYYVLRPGTIHYYGGTIAVFLFSKATLATILACKNANWGDGRTRLRWFLFFSSLIVFATFAPWYNLASVPQGDEAHYLLLTYSLIHDRDFVVGNNYRQGDYAEQFPPPMPGVYRWYDYASTELDSMHAIPLDPHVVTNARGEKLLWHDIGVPIVILPGYALGKRLGAVLTVAVVASTLPVAILEIAMALGASLPAAIITSIFFVLTPPLYCYSQSISPEVFGACACLWTAAFFMKYRERPRPLYVLAAGTGIAVMPWMVIRFWPPAGILFLVFAAYLLTHRKSSRASLVNALGLLCIASLVSLVVFAAFDHPHFGTYLPNGGLHLTQHENPRSFWWRLDTAFLGMLYDSAFGLLPTAPLYIAGVAGIIVVLRRRDFWGAAILLLPSAIYIGLLCRTSFWDGGWCPPGRYILCGAALLAPAAALVMSRQTKRFLAILGGWSLFIDLIYTVDPFTRFPSIFRFQRPIPTGLMEFLHDRLQIYSMYSVLSVFPVMQVPQIQDYVLAYLWLALSVIAIAWLVAASRRAAPTGIRHRLGLSDPAG
jgi:hypothetical protein